MKPLRDVDWHALEWALGGGAGWQLHAGEELVARLRLTTSATPDAPAAHTATAEATEGQWLFTLTGWMIRKLTIHEAAAPSGPPLVKARPNLRHVWTLPRADGHSLRWQHAGLTSPDWICTDQDGRHLIALHDIRASIQLSADVAMSGRVLLQEAARDVPELSLAIVIGWFLLVTYRLDGAGPGGGG